MQIYEKMRNNAYLCAEKPRKKNAPEDIHVYSIDEVFMDVTNYLPTYKMTAHQLAMTMIRDVLAQTGITATAGIGTNMYLCKVAMDIMAKKMPADKDGVPESTIAQQSAKPQQLDLFTDYEALALQEQQEQARLDKERRLQEVQLKIKERFGKNAILRGLNYEEGATAKERNAQIGGHKA